MLSYSHKIIIVKILQPLTLALKVDPKSNPNLGTLKQSIPNKKNCDDLPESYFYYIKKA